MEGNISMFSCYKALFLVGAVTFISYSPAFAQDDEEAPVKEKKIVKVVKVIRKKKTSPDEEPSKEEEVPASVSKVTEEKDDEVLPKKKPVKKAVVKKVVAKEEDEEPEVKKPVVKKKVEAEEEEPEPKKVKTKKAAPKEEEKEDEPVVKKSKTKKSAPVEEPETVVEKEDIVVEDKNDDAPKKKKVEDKKEKEDVKSEPEKKEPEKKEAEKTDTKEGGGDSAQAVVFDRYTRPQLYFSPGAPWRIVYFSPNITYQGIVPVEGDTNLSLKDKQWCLNLKTKEPKKSCDDQEFLEKVAKKCEDVQVFSCIDRARESSWAKEKWKTKDQIVDGIQNIFHEGMEARIREFVDRGGKLAWVPTPPWCMNISPKSCSDLAQVDPRNGVNQGGKNFMMSAENCHFYEMADCTAEAIDSNWAKQKWGDDLDKIRAGINEFIFENHLKRISRYVPSVVAPEKEDSEKTKK